MRPTTLAEACQRAQTGEPIASAFATAIGDFLQAYFREPMLPDEAPLRRACQPPVEPPE